ncbi:extracellular solute-binding protein [Kineosporia succinea]|uniref:N,N'-diacetylchitobiose transport system substrate-binding protein n=1 Tax=Kineosporia succinea TaxID=84632 RepID=A0ABT9PDB0_9ACTN|nr:extracellular solute-binding protein [Kineosporia succinea]MDP9830694.1 N,N'-diacetylchitobiose transport system substrate-binding protein [Kineosporia succinea]
MNPQRSAVAIGIAAALTLTACASTGSSSDTAADTSAKTVPAAKGDGKTLTVWTMNGDYTEATIEAINAEFTRQTGAKVDVQIQEWDGITTRISTALSTANTPDVLDLGNTQVASFAANGGLVDLTAYKEDLAGGRTWLAGLEEPATVDGSLYAVPGFAGARAVVYNKKIWADAGVTEVPATYDELTAALDKVKAANTASDFSAFYLPGQYWAAGMQWVWDAGGEIATNSGDTWTGGFETPEAQKGLNDFKAFQDAYSSKASKALHTDNPDFNQLFADEKASAILTTTGSIAKALEINPKMKSEDIGTFPLPGISGKTQPAMLGGSDWGIAAKSDAVDLALVWTKIATSPDFQDKYVFGKDGWIPNSTEGIEAAQATTSEQLKGFFTAALNSKATPAAAQWAAIEGDKSINQLFSSIATGDKTPEEAAKTFDAHLTDTL